MPACHDTHVWKVFCQRNRIPLIKHKPRTLNSTQLNPTHPDPRIPGEEKQKLGHFWTNHWLSGSGGWAEFIQRCKHALTVVGLGNDQDSCECPAGTDIDCWTRLKTENTCYLPFKCSFKDDICTPDLSVKDSNDKCYFISSGLQPGTSWWGGYWVYTSAIWRKDFLMKLVNRWCWLVLNGTVWYCMFMVAHGITCYSIFCCMCTKEMVLSDWPNTGAGWEKTSKSGCCKAFPSSISIF